MSTMKLADSNKLFDAKDASADATSDAFRLDAAQGAAINFYSPATGTRAGSIYIDVGPDLDTNHLVTVATIPVTASTLLAVSVEIDTHFRFGRVRWEKTGTVTGAIDATLNVHEQR